MTNGVSRIAIV